MRCRFAVASLVLLIAGCGGSSAKYDSIKDESVIEADLGEGIEDVKQGNPRISVRLSGKGNHPKEWKCDFTVAYRDPKATFEDPGNKLDFWGENPTLALGYSDGSGKTFTQYRVVDHSDGGFLNDYVSFDMSIDDLVYLLDHHGKYSLNKRDFIMSQKDQDALKSAIMTARETTNAGK